MQVQAQDIDEEQRTTGVYVRPTRSGAGVPTRRVAVAEPAPSASNPTDARVRLRVLGRYLSDRISTREHTLALAEPFEFGTLTSDLADPYLDPRHVRIVPRKLGFSVEDLRSRNGVFVLLRHPVAIQDGDSFRIGHQLLRFRRTGPLKLRVWARVDVMLTSEAAASSQTVVTPNFVVGRHEGHMRLPEDPYVSRRHCCITRADNSVVLEDCGSNNGTYQRLRHATLLPYGTVLLTGQTIWRVERPC